MSSSPAASTLNDLLDQSAALFAGRDALGLAFAPAMTYRELHRRTLDLACALTAAGCAPGDPVAILAENSPNWGLTALAILRAGGVLVPILPDFPQADVHHVLEDSGARFLFFSSRQAEKIAGVAGGRLKTCILFDSPRPAGIPCHVLSFADLKSEQRAAPKPVVVRASDLAAIIYTSGTSGHAKAVMLSHENFCANVAAAAQVVPMAGDWRLLSLLPLAHAYEFTCGFLLPLSRGASITYPGRPPTPTVLAEVCAALRPTAFCAVPLIMEKIHKKRVAAVMEKKALLRWAGRVPVLRRLLARAAGRKLLRFFGGALKLVAIGGAALNRETENFLRESRFPFLVGYGLTEAAPLLAVGPWGDPGIAPGSTGKPVPGVEISIHDPDPASGTGEIYARGPSIMRGYYKNAALTAATLSADGWLATGDLGRFDAAGNLHILGRSKNVIVLSNGENVYPEAIEDKINASLVVADSLVVEKNGRLQARVFFDPDSIALETAGMGEEECRQHKAALLAAIKRTVNASLPVFSRLHACVEQETPFVKTATHKIKRYLYQENAVF